MVWDVWSSTPERICRFRRPSATQRFGRVDDRDRQTIAALVADGHVGKGVKVDHRDDQRESGIWGADVAAYAVSQAIARNDIRRLGVLAPRLVLRTVDAANTGQQLHHRLQELQARAVEAGAGIGRDDAQAMELIRRARTRLDALNKIEGARRAPIAELPNIISPPAAKRRGPER